MGTASLVRVGWEEALTSLSHAPMSSVIFLKAPPRYRYSVPHREWRHLARPPLLRRGIGGLFDNNEKDDSAVWNA